MSDNSAALREYVEVLGRQRVLRDERVEFARCNPDLASTADIRFLADRVQMLEEYLNDLHAAGAIRPRHEWAEWHDDYTEQLRLCRERFQANHRRPA